MMDLCREFGISRKTGYKVWKRYQEEGIEALMDRSRRPYSSPNKTPRLTVALIVDLRLLKPTWGPKKLLWLLRKHYPDVPLPAESTIALILKREGLVKGRKRRRRATPTVGPLTEGQAPNDVWAIDYKGQFKLGNGNYCYPLTMTDQFSRFILLCEALESTRREPAQVALKHVFRAFGVPKVVRSDNGVPFASTGRCGLSRLGVWMMRQGIKLERIEPGHPEQNGRHERMHRTLKQETTRPARGNNLAQ
jgi:transposase InsO family protein